MVFVRLLSVLLLHPSPGACSLLTPAEVSAAIGRPVNGGTTSVVDHVGATTSTCPYSAQPLTITVMLSQFPSPAEATKEYADELKSSQGRDGATQKTTVEPGVGDRAYSSTMSQGTFAVASWSAVHGSRIVTIAVTGQGALAVPADKLRGLLVAALAR